MLLGYTAAIRKYRLEPMNTTPHHIVVNGNQAVGREVRSWLGRVGMSQTRLSEVLGYTQPQVSRKLRGAQPFRIDELLLIANHLDVTLGQLLGQELVNEKNPHLFSGEGSHDRASGNLVAGDGFEPSTSGL